MAVVISRFVVATRNPIVVKRPQLRESSLCHCPGRPRSLNAQAKNPQILITSRSPEFKGLGFRV